MIKERLKGPFETPDGRWLKVESVPLDTEKLTAGGPQSPRRVLASSLWGYKGRGAVTEMKERVTAHGLMPL